MHKKSTTALCIVIESLKNISNQWLINNNINIIYPKQIVIQIIYSLTMKTDIQDHSKLVQW